MPSDPTPRTNPPPAGKPRRRPTSGGAGNWVWMLVVLFIIGIFILNSLEPSGAIEWSDFYTLITDPEASLNVKKVTFRGADQIVVEVDDPGKLPKDLQKKIARGNRLTVTRLQTKDEKAIIDRLQEMTTRDRKWDEKKKEYASTGQPGFHWEQQDEQYTWLKAMLYFLALPALLLLGVFLFLLPRFRDPLGGGFLSNYIKSPARR